ncbi:MAG: DUF2270 domain-containing protein [Alphaproteobacteria bacterium]|nr:DUF2270 domain-containing protein [Alphaproteobacteria bacterium]
MNDPHAHETALVHLYRGELGRMTTYRVRLDTTTNWALGAVVATVTFTLGQPEAPHDVLLLPYVLGCVFAGLEARRYCEMEVSRERVHTLEAGFFAPMLGGPSLPGWQEAIAASLHAPSSPVGIWQALAVRARRNYVWLFLALYGSWWAKLGLSGKPLVAAASTSWMSGETAIAAATLLVLPWVVLGLMGKTAGMLKPAARPASARSAGHSSPTTSTSP